MKARVYNWFDLASGLDVKEDKEAGEGVPDVQAEMGEHQPRPPGDGGAEDPARETHRHPGRPYCHGAILPWQQSLVAGNRIIQSISNGLFKLLKNMLLMNSSDCIFFTHIDRHSHSQLFIAYSVPI